MNTDTLRKEFGKRVQFFRAKKRLTQERLAELIDRTPETVSNIERGISSARIETAASIAEALGVSLSDLLDLPICASQNRKRNDLIKELVALALDQDEAVIKLFIDHLRNFSELPR